jgi:hypothetical protein
MMQPALDEDTKSEFKDSSQAYCKEEYNKEQAFQSLCTYQERRFPPSALQSTPSQNFVMVD